MWEFQGMDDPTWLWVGLPATLEHPVLKTVVNELYGGTGELESMPPGVIPLYCDRAISARWWPPCLNATIEGFY
jgi:hypothetical protein